MLSRIKAGLCRLLSLPGRKSAATKKADTFSRWDSAESLHRQFSAAAKKAEASAYLKAFVFDSSNPVGEAKAAAKAAIAAEHVKVNLKIAGCGEAERAHIRARYAMRTAALKLRQAERSFGPNSASANKAREANIKAIRAFGKASAELYLAQMGLV